MAKLRATVERGEVSKQKLEYELALAHKAANQEKRVAAEKEASLLKMNGGFKGESQSFRLFVFWMCYCC